MFQSYHRLLRLLRKKCPPAFPVHVRRVKLVDKDGYCTKIGERFQIRINKELSEAGAIDALLHEWAHARCWSHLHDALDHAEFEKMAHDASWGVAYSEVYRVFEQQFE
jgi:hypothetical protein